MRLPPKQEPHDISVIVVVVFVRGVTMPIVHIVDVIPVIARLVTTVVSVGVIMLLGKYARWRA